MRAVRADVPRQREYQLGPADRTPIDNWMSYVTLRPGHHRGAWQWVRPHRPYGSSGTIRQQAALWQNRLTNDLGVKITRAITGGDHRGECRPPLSVGDGDRPRLGGAGYVRQPVDQVEPGRKSLRSRSCIYLHLVAPVCFTCSAASASGRHLRRSRNRRLARWPPHAAKESRRHRRPYRTGRVGNPVEAARRRRRGTSSNAEEATVRLARAEQSTTVEAAVAQLLRTCSAYCR